MNQILLFRHMFKAWLIFVFLGKNSPGFHSWLLNFWIAKSKNADMSYFYTNSVSLLFKGNYNILLLCKWIFENNSLFNRQDTAVRAHETVTLCLNHALHKVHEPKTEYKSVSKRTMRHLHCINNLKVLSLYTAFKNIWKKLILDFDAAYQTLVLILFFY